jgi:hypothetical protein
MKFATAAGFSLVSSGFFSSKYCLIYINKTQALKKALILLTKFDLSISNSLNQIHIEKISFKRHELHTDQGL